MTTEVAIHLCILIILALPLEFLNLYWKIVKPIVLTSYIYFEFYYFLLDYSQSLEENDAVDLRNILGILFCLNVNGFTLYKFIFDLPGFNSVRAVHRIINVELFCFILIFAFVFKELNQHNKVLRNIIALFPVVVIADNLINPAEIMKFDKMDSQNKIKEIKENIRINHNQSSKAVAYFPYEIFQKNPYNQLFLVQKNT